MNWRPRSSNPLPGLLALLCCAPVFADATITLRDFCPPGFELTNKLRQRTGVEITPLSYPKYFFPKLQGITHATREYDGKIICIVEPQMGMSFRIAVCDMKTKKVRLLQTRYKTAQSVEGVFANLSFEL